MFPVYLKIKVKSLAAEAKIIRHEAAKYIGEDNLPIRMSLSGHRRFDLRREVRPTLIAYGYLRGRDYRRIETTVERQPDWEAVKRMVVKYGDKDQQKGFAEWSKVAAEQNAAIIKQRITNIPALRTQRAERRAAKRLADDVRRAEWNAQQAPKIATG